MDIVDRALEMAKGEVSGTHGGVTVSCPADWFGDIGGKERVLLSAVLTGRAAKLDAVISQAGDRVGWDELSEVAHGGIYIQAAYRSKPGVDGDGVSSLLRYIVGREAKTVESMAMTFRRRPAR